METSCIVCMYSSRTTGILIRTDCGISQSGVILLCTYLCILLNYWHLIFTSFLELKSPSRRNSYRYFISYIVYTSSSKNQSFILLYRLLGTNFPLLVLDSFSRHQIYASNFLWIPFILFIFPFSQHIHVNFLKIRDQKHKYFNFDGFNKIFFIQILFRFLLEENSVQIT